MIGNRIKQLREEKGLSQAELANAIQIAQSSIGNYERELRAPDSETILALAKYFNVTSDYLLGLADDPQKQPSATEELGLSYDAVERLIAWNTRYPNGNEALSTLSRLITYSEFFHVLYSISLLLENASNEFNASGSSSEDIEALSQKAAEMGFSVVKNSTLSMYLRAAISKKFDDIIRGLYDSDIYKAAQQYQEKRPPAEHYSAKDLVDLFLAKHKDPSTQ